MELIQTIKAIQHKAENEQVSIEQFDYRFEMLKNDFFKTFQERKSRFYITDHQNEKQFNLLLMYFSKHPNFLKPENKTHSEIANYSFEKGLMLLGNVGCGKTEILTNFSSVLKKFQLGFISQSCLDVEESFATSGYESLQGFTKPYTKLFDDLGFDDVVKFYGNEERIMIRIIEKRHRQFIDSGIKTHFTTNLSGKEIKARYGERIHSRLIEMCNIVNFEKDAKDRRH